MKNTNDKENPEARKEFIKIAPNVRLHVTDLGEGKPLVLDLRPQLAMINIPTVIFHGRYDKICSFQLAEQMHQAIRGSELIPFDHSGHALFVEETQKFNQKLEEFILS